MKAASPEKRRMESGDFVTFKNRLHKSDEEDVIPMGGREARDNHLRSSSDPSCIRSDGLQ